MHYLLRPPSVPIGEICYIENLLNKTLKLDYCSITRKLSEKYQKASNENYKSFRERHTRKLFRLHENED